MNISKLIGVIIGLALIIGCILILNNKDEEIVNANNITKNVTEVKAATKPTGAVNFQSYNHQFAEGAVLGVLDRMIGNKRAVFYLPSIGYINISSGESFGVVFAIQNVLEGGGNYFEYSFEPDALTLTNCKVSKTEATSWIITGAKSFGKITGGWVDKMSVYFKFPSGVRCKAIYNFKILKDKETYFEDKLVFNII